MEGHLSFSALVLQLKLVMASVTVGFQNKLTLESFKKSKSIEVFSLSSFVTVNMLSSFM